MKIEGHECYLVDDGTLDTVISIDGKEYRLDAEYTSQFRHDSGAMTDEGFAELCKECINE